MARVVIIIEDTEDGMTVTHDMRDDIEDTQAVVFANMMFQIMDTEILADMSSVVSMYLKKHECEENHE